MLTIVFTSCFSFAHFIMQIIPNRSSGIVSDVDV